MAQAEPSSPTSTESISEIPGVSQAIELVSNIVEVQGRLFSMTEMLGENIVALQGNDLNIVELQEKVLLITRKLAKRERRLDERCQRIEETQGDMLEALNELSDRLSKEKSVEPAPPNALQQLFANLLCYGETLPAMPKKTRARIAAVFTGPTGLFPADLIPSLNQLRTLHTVLKTHWEASRHLDTTKAVPYPWLSFGMALCYFLAVSTWLATLMYFIYKACTVGIIAAIWGCLIAAIPYTIGLGKPFATIVLLFPWLVLTVVQRA